MNRWDWRRWTGVLGLVYVVIQGAALVLFLVAGNPPDFGDANKYASWINSNGGLFMGDAFLTNVATAVLLMQFTGIRAVIRGAGEDWEWAAALFFGAGLVTAAILIVGSAGEATAVFVSGSGTDPTIVRAAWAGAWMVLTFVYLPAAIAFGTAAYAVLRAGILGPVGLLPIILGATPVVVWFVAVSIVLLGSATRAGQKGVSTGVA